MPEAYREHRTHDELDRLLRCDFYIPINRSRTQAFVDREYPGWEWAELFRTTRAMGIHLPTASGGGPGRGGRPARCNELVLEAWFSSPQEWVVAWIGGIVTRSTDAYAT